jgi:PAS domain S-box-containing protein
MKEKRSRFRRLLHEAGRGKQLQGGKWTTRNLRALLHELDIYQTKLEIQNEKLRESRLLLERSGARYQDLYEFAPVGYLTLDKEGIILEINRTGAKLLRKKRTHLLNRNLGSFLEATSARELARHLAETTGEDYMKNLEVALERGLPQYLHLKFAPRREGREWQFRVAAIDITEMRRIQEELKEARQKAERATQAKSEFLASMSHEIRTPMTITQTALELLMDTGLEEEQAQLVEMAMKSSRSLLGLLNDLLDLSKIEAHKLNIQPEPTDLYLFLENTVNLFVVDAELKELELLLEIDPAIPKIAVFDPNRLLQVLTNLLSNAIKFTEKGLITLGVLPDGANLRFFVRDTGIGIPEDQLDRLFESFTQLSPSPMSRCRGAGLGLTIAKRLVELMGGKIWAKSSPGRGSVFYFTLPLLEPTAEIQAEAGVDDLPALSARILLVEDDPQIRRLIGMTLDKWSCEVAVATDGQEAVRIWERSGKDGFDLILMNLQMPGMDGLESTRLIRETEGETEARVPIVALTAHAWPEMERQCLEAGMDARVTKPIDLRHLHEVIRRHLALT